MDDNKKEMIVLTIIQVVSFSFAVYIFYRFAQQTSSLRRLQNHVLMCLLIVATWAIIIELPNTQKYLWTGFTTIQASWFCSFWNISFLSTNALNRVLMAFMCVERHFLVFRPQIHQTHRSRLLFHYIPIIFIVLTVFLYQLITNVLISCPQLYFNYSLFMCGYTCSVLINNLGAIQIWILVFVPTVITVVGCILLPIRFIIQKRQLQRVQWHRARKMIVQTTIIASVYSICWLPYSIILQLLINNHLSFLDPTIAQFIATAPYVISLLTPFIIFHTVRRPLHMEIIERIKRRLFPQRLGAVQPADNFVAHQVNHRLAEEHQPN